MMALKGCYNWDEFFEDCKMIAVQSLVECDGLSAPGKGSCMADDWASYQTTLEHGLPVEVP